MWTADPISLGFSSIHLAKEDPAANVIKFSKFSCIPESGSSVSNSSAKLLVVWSPSSSTNSSPAINP